MMINVPAKQSWQSVPFHKEQNRLEEEDERAEEGYGVLSAFELSGR